MNKNLVYLFSALAVLLLEACTGDSVYRRVETVKGDLWRMGQAYSFTLDAPDTLSGYDVYVDIRTSDGYPWRDIHMVGEVYDSLSRTVERDTLSCRLSDDQGRATGHGLSNVKENPVLWKKDFRFPRSGKYVFSLSHAMRNVELPGVSSVGLRLEYAGGGEQGKKQKEKQRQ